MNRCTFRADGPTGGSKFALAEGRKATVDGCLFEGFETALDVQASPGMAVSLKRSIFLSARPGEEAIGRADPGPLDLRPGGRGPALGRGLLDPGGRVPGGRQLQPTTPLEVEVTASAFLVKTLVVFEGDAKAADRGRSAPSAGRAPTTATRCTGPAWASFPGRPADLEAWSKLTGETGGKAQDLKLAKEPPDPTTPKDCAMLDETASPSAPTRRRWGRGEAARPQLHRRVPKCQFAR